jgi:hypothetical protein
VICAPDQAPEKAIQQLASQAPGQHKYRIHILETDQPPWAPRVVYVGALGLRGGMRLGMTNISDDDHGAFLYTSILDNTILKDNITPGVVNHVGNQEYTKHRIPSYHVSCKSYRPSKILGHENLVGMVLYTYDGKTEWHLNGLHCKAGYIVIKKATDIAHIDSSHGQVHGKLFKSCFGCEPGNNIVAGGFAYSDGRWRFNSFVLNDSSNTNNQHGFHSAGRAMGVVERRYVMYTIRRWVTTGEHTFYTKNIEFDPLGEHTFYTKNIEFDPLGEHTFYTKNIEFDPLDDLLTSGCNIL